MSISVRATRIVTMNDNESFFRRLINRHRTRAWWLLLPTTTHHTEMPMEKILVKKFKNSKFPGPQHGGTPISQQRYLYIVLAPSVECRSVVGGSVMCSRVLKLFVAVIVAGVASTQHHIPTVDSWCQVRWAPHSQHNFSLLRLGRHRN